MSPEQLAQALAQAVAGEPAVSGGGRWARASVTVEPARWYAAAQAARDEFGCDFFDWLTAVDELDRGYGVVLHVWSTAARHGVLVQTTVDRAEPVLDSVVPLYPGANWAERETYEMFGVGFRGHPDLRPLLLSPDFEGHPLRKDFVLASRVAKAWPGAVEPGESHVDGPGRRAPARPPGVPPPGEWGGSRTPGEPV
jgi:NADH-quinone oxidoreductase subunit C